MPFIDTCQCGRANDEVPANGRIVGGKAVPPNKYPWMTMLTTGGCTGAIISHKAVLTAAHCVEGDTYDVIRIGSNSQNHGGLMVNASTIEMHPNYKPYPFTAFDAAILILEKPLQFSKKIRRICLPSANLMVSIENIHLFKGTIL